MGKQITVFVCSTVLAFVSFASPAFAQQKTIRACEKEWRESKAGLKANAITEKDYLVICHPGGVAAQPTAATSPAAAPGPVPAASSQTIARQKTVAACQKEWRESKTALKANGVSEKDYIAVCHAAAVAAPPDDGP